VSESTCWESIKTEGVAVLDKLKNLIREGNIRVVGIVVAPVLAAVATLLALLGECTIDVERVQHAEDLKEEGDVAHARQ
jgi:hypothetical protein